jgi:hypothetical protein
MLAPGVVERDCFGSFEDGLVCPFCTRLLEKVAFVIDSPIETFCQTRRPAVSECHELPWNAAIPLAGYVTLFPRSGTTIGTVDWGK